MNMSTYKAIWTLLIVFIVVPAFIMASGVEGLSFAESRLFMEEGLNAFMLPEFLSAILSYPVTVMATLFPSSSSLSTIFGNLLWSWIGPLTVLMFFLFIDPPFYKREN